MDDALGLLRGVARYAGVVGVVPDAAEPELLRRHDFPFVVVADHPGIGCRRAEPFERMAVDGGLGLALTELAFDLDVVEAMPEVETFDLGALDLACAIGYQS